MPSPWGIVIMDGDSPCYIQAEMEGIQTINKGKGAEISTTKQLEKGLRKGQSTYVAAMVQIKPDVVVEVPDEIGEVLKEFEDVMPKELPKELPPRRQCDHQIELEPGATPPAKAPYRMAPSELAELRKQLDELLDGGLLQPSKAPYGAPVLKFIEGYSKNVSVLIDLLKADRKWVWTEECQAAFDKLKLTVSSELVLRLPDFDLPFEVHMDASDRALGGVLVQAAHPVAYESRKWNEAEQRYSAHEKEMATVVHCLDTWRPYLLGDQVYSGDG
ncbi:hypothetical protein LWI29_016484 [Acer saccharum]|uniref:Reverse transcriptase/retrotransposon-derived protein RNase H-like domain-containing protein n=1 Tax=Acer saccharum TaxID=4024 RepID=A0AA39STX5_ACESA|nr:hypothetical protein LWI29_016484 [Acer saccharum]